MATETLVIDIGVVGIEMSAMPGIKNIVENIRHMRERAIRSVYQKCFPLAESMEAEARALARKTYISHPELHGTARYPGAPAADSIDAQALRNGDNVGVALYYRWDVVMYTSRRRVTYGGILEANYHGQTAVIRPVWEKNQLRFMAMMSGAMNSYKGG